MRLQDKRGSVYDRRRNQAFCLRIWGNGTTCPCVHCQTLLSVNESEGASKLTLDRIVPGGSYIQSNIQPACLACNQSRSDNPDWTGPNPLPTANTPYGGRRIKQSIQSQLDPASLPPLA